MVAFVDQRLGDVERFDTLGRERIREQRFVHAIALEGRRHHGFQAGLDVIGVEDCVFGGLFEAVGAMAQHIGQRTHEHAHLAMEGSEAAKGVLALAIHFLNEAEAILILHDEGYGRIVCQRLRQHGRAGARTAAAMRGREGLVEVDVHGIDTEVSGANAANNGVEIRAVAIEIAARIVNQVCDLADIRFEQAARVWIGQHDAGNVGAVFKLGAEILHVDAAALVGLDLVDLEAALNGCRRVRAMRRGRDENTGTGLDLTTRHQRPPDRHHAAKLAMRTSLGAHRDGGHAGQRLQPGRKLVDHFERALNGGLGLERVNVGEARHARDFLIQPRIVFHRA